MFVFVQITACALASDPFAQFLARLEGFAQKRLDTRKTRHLTNGGVLKILCPDVEELLGKILVDSLNKYFGQWQREV